MRYMLKTDGIEFEVAKPPAPKTEQNGVQKVDKATGWPIWTVGLLMLDVAAETASEVVVAIAAPSIPAVRWREPVEVSDLEIFPWSQKGRDGDIRSGVAFRVKEIRPVGVSLRAAA
jgi:hypothetical protein